MKKVFSLLLAVLMIASLATTAFAAKAGEEVNVTFYANADISDFELTLDYDSSVLEFVKGSSSMLGYCTAKKAAYATTENIAAGQPILTVTFVVKADAPAGTYAVSARDYYAYNADGEEVNVVISGGSITVEGEPQPTEPQPTEHVHVWSAWVVIDDGNCQKKSVEERTCSVCGETETREGEYGPHQYKDGVCVICGTKDPNYVEPTKPVDPDLDDEPKTGDITPVIMMTIVCVVAVAGAFFFVFKRKAAK